jgi:hypothetical protein
VILYRYFKAEHAIQTLENMCLKVSRFSELNDPFELAWTAKKPEEKDIRKSLRERRNNPAFIKKAKMGSGLTGKKIKKELKRSATRSILEGRHPYIVAKLLSERLELADSKSRVLCFSSSDIDNSADILMWSHYADHHRGVRIGFNLSSSAGFEITKITYRDDRPEIDLYAGEVAVQAAVKESLRFKSSAWSYEAEHRIYLFAEQCFSVAGLPHDFARFKSQDVVSIDAGMRFSDIAKLSALKEKSYKNAKLRNAVMHDSDYAIKYIEVN